MEIWKRIEGYNGNYAVSNYGRVRRETDGHKTFRGRIMNPWINRGYQLVMLRKDGKGYQVFVHKLVFNAFYGSVPHGLEINHIDGNKTNNRASNLEAVTRKENAQHALRLGLRKRARRTKLSKEFADYIRVLREKENFKVQALADMFGFRYDSVANIINNKSYI